jgi:hypothetical protein
MDKVQKHNSFITNTPSSESYKKINDKYFGLLLHLVPRSRIRGAIPPLPQ